MILNLSSRESIFCFILLAMLSISKFLNNNNVDLFPLPYSTSSASKSLNNSNVELLPLPYSTSSPSNNQTIEPKSTEKSKKFVWFDGLILMIWFIKVSFFIEVSLFWSIIYNYEIILTVFGSIGGFVGITCTVKCFRRRRRRQRQQQYRVQNNIPLVETNEQNENDEETPENEAFDEVNTLDPAAIAAAFSNTNPFAPSKVVNTPRIEGLKAFEYLSQTSSTSNGNISSAFEKNKCPVCKLNFKNLSSHYRLGQCSKKQTTNYV